MFMSAEAQFGIWGITTDDMQLYSKSVQGCMLKLPPTLPHHLESGRWLAL